MKHICIFSANYLPNTGGVERYTYNLANTLFNDGYKVTIVTSNVFMLNEYEFLSNIDGTNSTESKDSPFIEIYRLPCINLLKGRFPVLRFFSKQFIKLNNLIEQNHFDLVIVNTRFYLHSLYGSIIGKKSSNKVIAIEHGSAHLTVNNKFWDLAGHVFEHFITSLIKHNIKDFYGVSQKCNEWLLHFNIHAKGILYNAVSIDEIEQIKKTPSTITRKTLSIPENSKIVVFTGRLVKEKGIDILVKAINILNTEYRRNDIHLLVAGDGPLFLELSTNASSNIHFLGKLSFQEVIYILNDSDIFCLPTRSEGFTTSGLEAACCNAYIIATPVGGITELLLDNSYGTILPSSPTPRNICEAIFKVIDDPKALLIANQKCYQTITTNFTWDKTASKVENLV